MCYTTLNRSTRGLCNIWSFVTCPGMCTVQCSSILEASIFPAALFGQNHAGMAQETDLCGHTGHHEKRALVGLVPRGPPFHDKWYQAEKAGAQRLALQPGTLLQKKKGGRKRSPSLKNDGSAELKTCLLCLTAAKPEWALICLRTRVCDIVIVRGGGLESAKWVWRIKQGKQDPDVRLSWWSRNTSARARERGRSSSHDRATPPAFACLNRPFHLYFLQWVHSGIRSTFPWSLGTSFGLADWLWEKQGVQCCLRGRLQFWGVQQAV